MDRRWDNPASTSASPLHSSQNHALPGINDLAKGVPANGQHQPAESPTWQGNVSVRDSGNWSMPTTSKHSSVISSAASGLQLPSIASQRTSPNGHYSGHHSGERSPFSASFSNGISAHGPTSAAQEHPPSAPPSGLTQINQPFDFNQPPRSAEFPQESRRSSIASGVGHLAIQSPIASNNASQTSLANNLQRERGIQHGEPMRNGIGMANGNGRPSTAGNPSMPLSNRRVQRTAPPIITNPRSEWPNVYADAPTKGHPYAFPDPEMSKNMPPVEEERATSSHRSRRDSIGAASMSSSIFTSDSRLPSGQQRMEDDHSSPTDDGESMSYFPPHSTSDLGSVSHHHHQLQHKQLSGLIGPPDSPSGVTPYSRTPELRVSHKLAERKRRSEMKGLFDELRAQLPQDNRVSKTSKWEILTKAIEHVKALTLAYDATQKHCEAIKAQANKAFSLQQENKEMHEEISRMHEEISRMRQQMQSNPNVNHYHQPPPPPPPSAASQPSNQGQQQQQRPTLPALTGQSSHAAPPPPSAMQGIQYST